MSALPPDARGVRIDHAIYALLTAHGRPTSVREVRRALKDGRIRVEGRVVAPGRPAAGGERVDLDGFVPRAEAQVRPATETDEVQVVSEDDDVLVLNKPSGRPTHPLRPDDDSTLLSVAVALAPSVAHAGPPLEGGLVHRLDLGTSGVVVFAKTRVARAALRRAFRAHRVQKIYDAITVLPSWSSRVTAGRIEGRGARVRVWAEGATVGLPASSMLKVLQRTSDRAWISAETWTGRRHQIRAHLAHLDAPIVGDPLYGGPRALRLGLHAREVVLPDGRTFFAPAPPDFEALLTSS